MSKSIKSFIVLTLMLSFAASAKAMDVTAQPLKARTQTTVANMDMVIKDNFIKAKYASAENRFIQSNVKASYDDFNDLIQRASHDDYVFLVYAMKMAEFGFFDLSDDLIKKLDNNEYTAAYVKDIKNFYYPTAMVNPRDIVYLADAYSNIVYNNMAIETTSELLNTVQARESDYKNYLIALGYYKSNNLKKALKYINNAVMENDANINYLSLKAKILADAGKTKQALKVLDKIKKVEFTTIDFQRRVGAIEEYVLYKTSKDEALKDYHLAHYYHLQGKSLLATKVLQSAIIKSKQYAPQIFALLGRIYYENDESQKALEFASRAFRDDSKNYVAALTLADISYEARKYDEALKYYKQAKKVSKLAEPSVGIAKTYLALEKDKKSKKLYEKLLKKYDNNEEVLIESLKVFPQKADYYLPKVASIDISNNDIWLGLANLAIKDKNYNMAMTFLNNSYYIDENNFRYYYYLSQVLRAKGDIELANQSLIRCSTINSDYEIEVDSGQDAYEK